MTNVRSRLTRLERVVERVRARDCVHRCHAGPVFVDLRDGAPEPPIESDGRDAQGRCPVCRGPAQRIRRIIVRYPLDAAENATPHVDRRATP